MNGSMNGSQRWERKLRGKNDGRMDDQFAQRYITIFDVFDWLQTLSVFACKVVLFLILSTAVNISFILGLGFLVLYFFPYKLVVILWFMFFSFIYCTQWLLLYERKHSSIGLSLSLRHCKWIMFGLMTGLLMSASLIVFRYVLIGNSVVLNDESNTSTCIQLFLFVFFFAGVEELLFRGYIFVLIRNWLGVIPALCVTSVLFSLLHLPNAFLFHSSIITILANTLVLGFLLGIALLVSKTIWFPIGLHAGWNFLQFSVCEVIPNLEKLLPQFDFYQPMLLVDYNFQSIHYSVTIEMIFVCIISITVCVFLIRSNKALYRALGNFFRKTEAAISDSV